MQIMPAKCPAQRNRSKMDPYMTSSGNGNAPLPPLVQALSGTRTFLPPTPRQQTTAAAPAAVTAPQAAQSHTKKTGNHHAAGDGCHSDENNPNHHPTLSRLLKLSNP